MLMSAAVYIHWQGLDIPEDLAHATNISMSEESLTSPLHLCSMTGRTPFHSFHPPSSSLPCLACVFLSFQVFAFLKVALYNIKIDGKIHVIINFFKKNFPLLRIK